MRIINVTILGGATAAMALTFAACSASYDERMAYLRTVANQGAETHQLLVDQEAPRIDVKRCTEAWAGLANQEDFPQDIATGYSEEWKGQIQQFFVDSCVSGKPKPVPGDPVPPSPAPSPAASSSAVPTSSASASPVSASPTSVSR